MRNRKELNTLRRAFSSWKAKMLYLSEEISIKAMFLVEQHFLSHSLRLADALIGATAISHGLSLMTGNDKHSNMLKELQVVRFRP